MWQKAQHLAALLIEKKANILKEEEEISESCFPSKKTHLFCQLSSWKTTFATSIFENQKLEQYGNLIKKEGFWPKNA